MLLLAAALWHSYFKLSRWRMAKSNTGTEASIWRCRDDASRGIWAVLYTGTERSQNPQE